MPELRFRSQTTFNAHDSRQVNGDDGRVTVTNGVKHRCELVLNTILRLGGGKPAEVLTHLQSRFSDSYTLSDVRTALDKLKGARLIYRRGSGEYRASRDALNRWREIPKKNV